LEAPMGYGKTTAVKKFLDEEPSRSFWFTFPDLKHSEESFWNKFTDEIVNRNVQIGTILKSLGLPSDSPQMEKLFQVLSSLSFSERFLIVLDDFQNAFDLNLSKLIMSLAQEEIDGLHILIMTRDTSDIDFVDLLSKGLCNIITRNQLKFSEAELFDYCHLLMHNIEEEDLRKIYAYTDGWISFVYIILVGLDNGIPVGRSTIAEDLIERTLFVPYDTTTQAFLLMLSIMEDFTAAQAEFITGEIAAKHLLKKLNRQNSFLLYDEKTGIYKIHHVLLDFLRMKQNFTREETYELYNRLSDWYLEREDFQTAYGYLNQIGQTERILSHLNDPRNIRNVQFTFAGVHEMFNKAPRELLFQYPISYLVYMFYSIVKGRKNEVLSWEERLDELELYYRNLEGIEETYRNRILAETLIVRKFTLFNHISEIKASNRDILRLLKGQNSYLTFQEHEFTFGSPHYLYIYYRDIGSFRALSDILSENVGYAEFSNGCGTGCDSLARAEYALETGDFEKVERNLLEAMIKAKTMSQTAVMICAKFCQIRLQIIQGKLFEALKLLDQIQLEIGAQNNSLFNTAVDLCKGYIFASIGQPEQIPYWLQIGDMTDSDIMYQGIAYNYLVYGKALMASGKFIELDTLILKFKKHFSIFSNQLGLIYTKIFEAAAKYQLQGASIGATYLEIALTEAEQDGLVMPFVESATHIEEMLQMLSRKHPDNEYIARILSLCGQYKKIIQGQPHKSVVMTKREISILSLSAAGLNRKDIANRLFITEETVKSHFKNIYLKLEVKSKLSAIKLAQNRGYLVADELVVNSVENSRY
jgi:LuxR family maltose regulon positive regulatory protein